MTPILLTGASAAAYVLLYGSVLTAPTAAGTDDPITITTGGSYSGSWMSTSPGVPAVSVATSDPVTLEDCSMQGAGDLIDSVVSGTRISVENCTGTGENPGVSGDSPGRFLHATSFDSITVTHDEIDHTAGIYLTDYEGSPSAGDTVDIDDNSVHDIDGRVSTGSGFSATDSIPVQFVQLDKVRQVPGVDIGWNRVVNDPGQSRVEDNISMYLSSGTASSPIKIHDNLIDGAWSATPSSGSYSGGGIMLGDGTASDPSDEASYITATGNVVLNTVNYGMAIAAGHDITMSGNRILSDDQLPDGTVPAAQNVGIYVWNEYTDPFWGNDQASGNTVGWVKGSSTNDSWTPDCASDSCNGNTAFAGTIDASTIANEITAWGSRQANAGQTAGPQPAG